MNSYVWDFATGSAGLLVAAMNEMLVDAKNKIKSPDELYLKTASIKANQLLGIEILPSVYMLAILNMILLKNIFPILSKCSVARWTFTMSPHTEKKAAENIYIPV